MEGMFSTSAGYHEYIGEYHEYIGVFSEHQRVTIMQVGDIMIHVGGYHEYIGGCSIHRGFNISQRLLSICSLT